MSNSYSAKLLECHSFTSIELTLGFRNHTYYFEGLLSYLAMVARGVATDKYLNIYAKLLAMYKAILASLTQEQIDSYISTIV